MNIRKGQTINIIEATAFPVNGLAMLDADSVWLSFSRPWWDVRAWLWWWLTPGQKKTLVIRKDGRIYRTRVVRITKNILRIGVKT